eukprot:6187533-Pleurochrysis_carterae.AAC.3
MASSWTDRASVSLASIESRIVAAAASRTLPIGSVHLVSSDDQKRPYSACKSYIAGVIAAVMSSSLLARSA